MLLSLTPALIYTNFLSLSPTFSYPLSHSFTHSSTFLCLNNRLYKDGQHISTSCHYAKVKPKYLVSGSCHLACVTSFAHLYTVNGTCSQFRYSLLHNSSHKTLNPKMVIMCHMCKHELFYSSSLYIILLVLLYPLSLLCPLCRPGQL